MLLKILRYLLGSSLLCVSVATWGATSFYCAKTQSNVYLGESIGRVEQLCGKPTRSFGQEAPTVQSVSRMVYPKRYTVREDGSQQPVTLWVDIANNKIIAMYENGQPTDTVSVCSRGRAPLKIGQDVRQVYRMCGRPLLAKSAPRATSRQTDLVFEYQSGAYTIPNRLYFREYKLVRIE